MQRVYVHGFYTLAAALRPVRDLADEPPYKEVVWILWRAREQLEALLKNQVVPVKTCRLAGMRVIDLITEIVPADYAKAVIPDGEGDRTVGWIQSYNLREEVKRFETVLAEELRLVDTYAVSQKGVYSTPDLIDEAEMLIPTSVRPRMPAQAIADLRQAGRCLAFETPTASGFHLFRAVESVVGAYYEAITGRPKPTKFRNWQVYIDHLRKAGADARVVALLQHIKDQYRNPITHPELTLSLEEVQVLLGIAVSAIVQMLMALPSAKAETA